jgi:hypothetical protein
MAVSCFLKRRKADLIFSHHFFFKIFVIIKIMAIGVTVNMERGLVVGIWLLKKPLTFTIN